MVRAFVFILRRVAHFLRSSTRSRRIVHTPSAWRYLLVNVCRLKVLSRIPTYAVNLPSSHEEKVVDHRGGCTRDQ